MTVETRLSYRPGEVAQVLGCSRDTVFRLLAAGKLRSFRINTARFVSAAELERFVREREEAESNA